MNEEKQRNQGKEQTTEKIIVREEVLSNGKRAVYMRKAGNLKEHAHLEHEAPPWMRTDDN